MWEKLQFFLNFPAKSKNEHTSYTPAYVEYDHTIFGNDPLLLAEEDGC